MGKFKYKQDHGLSNLLKTEAFQTYQDVKFWKKEITSIAFRNRWQLSCGCEELQFEFSYQS